MLQTGTGDALLQPRDMVGGVNNMPNSMASVMGELRSIRGYGGVSDASKAAALRQARYL